MKKLSAILLIAALLSPTLSAQGPLATAAASPPQSAPYGVNVGAR